MVHRYMFSQEHFQDINLTKILVMKEQNEKLIVETIFALLESKLQNRNLKNYIIYLLGTLKLSATGI